MFKLVFIVLIFSTAINFANATIDCPKAKIVNLQPQTNAILVKLEGQDWHKVGAPDDPGTMAMYSALLAAQMAEKPVVIRYPDGYQCTEYELSTSAVIVRTYNE